MELLSSVVNDVGPNEKLNSADSGCWFVVVGLGSPKMEQALNGDALVPKNLVSRRLSAVTGAPNKFEFCVHI